MKRYYFEPLTLDSTKNKITKDENYENIPDLEITELVLVYCNTANNDQQHEIRVSHTFLLNNQFGKLLDISPKNFISL